MTIRIKRIYDQPARSDGRRILADRLWPRGLTKTDAKVDLWAKTVAPSHELRRWYGHDPVKWPEFKRRYFAELDANAAGVTALLGQLDADAITFVYGSKEDRLNNAAALKEYVEARLRRGEKKKGH